MKLRQNQAFTCFWIASTVSDFGTYVTTVALSVLVMLSPDLGAQPTNDPGQGLVRWR
ncbi:hypothetical protein BCL67_10171 [Nesterenkonia sandarakina]|uniref:Uncharacterized protein n=1 Tax=Nesterenkonia sandarakina TaxID=272918 RepID=A0A2T0YT22_9MICC|nr:hypothetical protein BCL67_10171 [Nesterenkonia sandarakina]